MELRFEIGSVEPREMDSETQLALSKAIILAVGRRIKGMERRRCNLHVTPGRNIHSTQIEIRHEIDGYVIALFNEGVFYDTISRSPIEFV